uniref:Uncharacterized protein n=1 Tax=Oryza glumipatula TaxID=40148 RepID=A0A0E0B9V8_9ORYZ
MEPELELVVAAEERECTAWTRAMRMPHQAACSPTPLSHPLVLLLRSATLTMTAARPLGSTALAKVAFLAVALWTVVPCSLWRTRFAVAPTVFSGGRSHIGATAALETWWWSSPLPSKERWTS